MDRCSDVLRGTIEPFEDFKIPDADQERFNEALAEELQDSYIGDKVLLPQSGKTQEATVISRKMTHDGKSLVGTSDPNPFFDSRIYTVELPDGGKGEFTTNTIADSLYSNMDEEGYDLGLLEGIISHRKLEYAIPIEKGYVAERS